MGIDKARHDDAASGIDNLFSFRERCVVFTRFNFVQFMIFDTQDPIFNDIKIIIHRENGAVVYDNVIFQCLEIFLGIKNMKFN